MNPQASQKTSLLLSREGSSGPPAAAPREAQQAAVGPGFVEKQDCQAARLLLVRRGRLAGLNPEASLAAEKVERAGQDSHRAPFRRSR
jgi:hypothetical protein